MACVSPLATTSHLAAGSATRSRLLDPQGSHIEQVCTAAYIARKKYVDGLLCFIPKADLADWEVYGSEGGMAKMQQFASFRCKARRFRLLCARARRHPSIPRGICQAVVERCRVGRYLPLSWGSLGSERTREVNFWMGAAVPPMVRHAPHRDRDHQTGGGIDRGRKQTFGYQPQQLNGRSPTCTVPVVQGVVALSWRCDDADLDPPSRTARL